MISQVIGHRETAPIKHNVSLSGKKDIYLHEELKVATPNSAATVATGSSYVASTCTY